jgi:hypothetical protein
MTASGALASGLQTWVREHLTITVGQATSAIVRFVESRRTVLWYTRTAVAVFLAARLVKLIFPGFYSGAVPVR